ncbi:MAG TPA: DUF4331 domain-containing protein [Chloroflexia bacterium]|nr:DUF4331 domain-containing protein [Chloroflexia bacterium]
MKVARVLNFVMAGALVLGLALVGLHSGQVSASSHREAPMISMDPAADNADLYAFVSPDKPDTVTIIATFYPFEEPVGGPNYFRFGDDVLYELHIDNVGDAQAHITYQFKFNTQVGNGNTFLYNTGPIESIDSANWNVKQFYSVTRINNGQSTVLGQNLKTPPSNVGAKSTPNYESLSDQAIQTLSDGSKVFAGQSDDPFFVDLNVFDLLSIRKLPGNAGGGVDGLKGYNVQTIALQVPITELTANGAKPSGPGDANAVIGVYSTASRQATRVLQTGGAAPQYSGNWVQVSRLGAPLVNEVVVPLAAKDLWNSSKPADDAQFLGGVTDPELAHLFKAIYNIQVPTGTRDDLVAIFLTGIKGATQPPNVKPAEELRLNLGVPPTAPDKVSNLGVVGGDLGGYPDGRRLADDVTDISLKAVAGAAYPLFHPDFKPDPLAAQLGDGVDANDAPFRSSFPYVAVAWSGTQSVPHGTQVAGGTGGGQAGGGGTPGMPRTGGTDSGHLADVYTLALSILAGLGGLTLVGGYAVRRRAAGQALRK